MGASVKRPGRDAEDSLSFNAGVKSGAVLLLPHTPSWRAQAQIHFAKLINTASSTPNLPLYLTVNQLEPF
jgi:hypothetical protein